MTLKSKGVYIYIFNLGNTYKILIKSRSKSVPMIGRKMGLTPTLVRTYIGVTTESLEHHTFQFIDSCNLKINLGFIVVFACFIQGDDITI